jgi:hypothetical protein
MTSSNENNYILVRSSKIPFYKKDDLLRKLFLFFSFLNKYFVEQNLIDKIKLRIVNFI